MRTLVVGAGAVGGYTGHLLHRAGREVTFLARPASARRLRAEGLKVLAADGTLHQDTVTVVEADAGGPYDVVLIATRISALSAVIETLVGSDAVGEETRIVPLLNGISHLDVLARAFGRRRLLGGAIRLGASLDPDGTVRVLAPGASLEIGPLEDTDGVDRVAGELRVPGLDVEVRQDIVTAMWSKWLFITGTAVLTITGGGRIDEIARTPTGARLAASVLDELCQVLIVEGVALPEGTLAGLGSALCDPSSRFAPSLYRDLVAGREAEVDVLDDFALRAEAYEVLTPLLDAARVRLQTAKRHITPTCRSA